MAGQGLHPDGENSRLLPDLVDSSSYTYRPNDKATGFLWRWCTVGTRTYVLILISQCLVAASSPPFQSSLTRLYKDFLCCQQDPSRCHDRHWCEIESGNATERELSTIFQYQSMVNALGGAISVSLWYWFIWPWLQNLLCAQHRNNMMIPLIGSQAGMLLLEVFNKSVAERAQAQNIGTTDFKLRVIFAPLVSFLFGGGPYVYWTMRENILSLSVGSSSSSTSLTPNNTHFNLRLLAFVFLTFCTLFTQWLSGKLTAELISTNGRSDTAYANCLNWGVGIFAAGLFPLLFLPKIPSPATSQPSTPVTESSPCRPEVDSERNGEAQQSQLLTQSYVSRMTRSISGIYNLFNDLASKVRIHPVTTRIIVSTIARGPLTSSVSSSFAIRYISRRLNVDTSEAVVWTTWANIAGFVVVYCLKGAAAITLRRRKDAQDASNNNNNSTIHHDDTGAKGTPASNSESTPISAQEQHPPKQEETPILFSHVLPSLFFLVAGLFGTYRMVRAPSLDPALTDVTEYVIIAIIFINVATSYTVFLDPILAGWFAEDKEPGVFAVQRIIDGVFTGVGAMLLNLGFHIEAGGGDARENCQIGWTYMGIMLMCVVAMGLLISAASVSRNR